MQRLLLIAVLLTLGWGKTVSAENQATTISVTTLADELNNDGDCSLREAVQAANIDAAVDNCPAGNGADLILLMSNHYYSINISGQFEDANVTGDIDITDDVTIRSGTVGNAIISGGNLDRVLDVRSGAAVTIENVTIRDGRSGGGAGAGVRLENGDLTLRNVTVSDNQATANGGGVYADTGVLTIDSSLIQNNVSGTNGGGIYATTTLYIYDSTLRGNSAEHSGGGLGRTTGTDFQMERTTVVDNEATNGGGLYINDGVVPIQIINSTISGNRALNHGGGIYLRQIFLKLYNVTVTDNTADFDGGNNGNGGGLYNEFGTEFLVANSIIADNEDVTTEIFHFFAPDCYGDFKSGGYNVVGKTNGLCTFSDLDGDLIGTTASPIDAKLLALAYNGGINETHGLQSDSPAVNRGNPNGCTDRLGTTLTTDQRGATRPQQGRCDAGAFETAFTTPTAVGLAATNATVATPDVTLLLMYLLTFATAILWYRKVKKPSPPSPLSQRLEGEKMSPCSLALWERAGVRVLCGEAAFSWHNRPARSES